MSTEPSRTAALFWSCASFAYYPRVAAARAWKTASYLALLGVIVALAVTLFFATQVVPLLHAAAKQTAGFVLSDGRLAAMPDAPAVLYDDGAHGMLLVRVAVDKEPPDPERRYDAVVTLRQRGVDIVLFGHLLRAAWPPKLALDVQRLDAVAFMDAWWLLVCMAVFGAAFLWFFLTQLLFSLIGALLLASLASPAREIGFSRGFNLAAYATTPGTFVMTALLWLAAAYRPAPLLVNWSWLPYLLVFFVYLAGAATALPAKPANPWQGGAKP